MMLRIKDLPPLIQSRALVNMQVRKGYSDSKVELISAFVWEDSPEGYDYWNDVNDRDFPVEDDDYNEAGIKALQEDVKSEFLEEFKKGQSLYNLPLSDEAKTPCNKEGYKETEGKLNYELDWEFVEGLAQRMADNKGKYEPYNWFKPIPVDSLKAPLTRHFIEVMKGNYQDGEEKYGHLYAMACNIMMIVKQLKNQENDQQTATESEGLTGLA